MSPSIKDPYDEPLQLEFIEDYTFTPLTNPYAPETDYYYPIWSCRMKSALAVCNRWDIVAGEDICPVVQDDMSPEEKTYMTKRIAKWKVRNAEARCLIEKYLGENYLYTTVGCDSAKALWDKIRHTHIENQRGLKALRVVRRMRARKYREGMSLEEFGNGFLEDYNLLRDYGVNYDQKTVVLDIIQALPLQDGLAGVIHPLLDRIFKDDSIDGIAEVLNVLSSWDYAIALRRPPGSGPSQGRRQRRN